MFKCEECGAEFNLRPEVLERYPGWTPKLCMDCRNRHTQSSTAKSSTKKPKASVSKGRDLTVAEVMDRFDDGPTSGIFTDGASEGNPGPGGWGTVYVVDGEIVDEAMGSEAHTTNNRMELTAMIAGLNMVLAGTEVDIYTDSQLVVNTLTKWAKGWEAREWTKKSSGPIANLELVKEAYRLAQARPNARIQWIRAHSGYRWNEYADSLATSYRRDIH